MTRSERERLVEQYLEGSMDFAQEENFFIQVAIDDELRRTLRSYRIVEEAIRKEREVGARGHAGSRRFIAGVLFGAPQLQPLEEILEAEAAEAPANGTVPESGKKRGSNHGKHLVLTIAAAGLVLLGWIGVDRLLDVETRDAGTPGVNAQTWEAAKPQDAVAVPDATPSAGDIQTSGTGQSRATRGESTDDRIAPSDESAETPQSAEQVSSEPNRAPMRLRIDSTLKNPPRQEPVRLPVEIDWGKEK